MNFFFIVNEINERMKWILDCFVLFCIFFLSTNFERSTNDIKKIKTTKHCKQNFWL